MTTITANYTPACLFRYCGPDGGGGNCGDCPDGLVCNEYLQCKPAPTSDYCTTLRCGNGTRIWSDNTHKNTHKTTAHMSTRTQFDNF